MDIARVTGTLNATNTAFISSVAPDNPNQVTMTKQERWALKRCSMLSCAYTETLRNLSSQNSSITVR